MDMLMHIVQNAKERDLEEWTNLLAAADSRFRLHEVKHNNESIIALLDIVWQPDCEGLV